jgi:hypothetical protein
MRQILMVLFCSLLVLSSVVADPLLDDDSLLREHEESVRDSDYYNQYGRFDDFALLQRALVNDASSINFRSTNEDNLFVPKVITLEKMFAVEDYSREEGGFLDTSDSAVVSEAVMDSSSLLGGLIRTFYPDIDYFEEGPATKAYYDYVDSVKNLDEVTQIKRLYSYVTDKVTTYGVPTGGESIETCLTQGVGQCRHMSAALREGLLRLDIENELVTSSPEKGDGHAWVRVTLQEEGRFKGMVFDLDPTWYKDPVPIPARDIQIPEPFKKTLIEAVKEAKEVIDLTGEWDSPTSVLTKTKHVTQTGNTARTQPGEGGYMFTLNGREITGIFISHNSDCENLDTEDQLRGIVSEDGQTINLELFLMDYSPATCTLIEGSGKWSALTWTRVPNDVEIADEPEAVIKSDAEVSGSEDTSSQDSGDYQPSTTQGSLGSE